VASRLASTARAIAAAIMVCVFGSLVRGDPARILGVFGLGLAVHGRGLGYRRRRRPLL